MGSAAVLNDPSITAAKTVSPHSMNVLALVLAGGSGTRFGALTAWRTKPALPFAGQFRAIDFTLSNCINSGIRQIALLTQYKSQSLIRHVHAGWGFLHRELGEFVDIWPAQQQLGERWYCGNVDAVHQNLDLVAAADPQLVLILSGTQIYSMDYSLLIAQHVSRGADLTIGTVETSVDDFGEHALVVMDGPAHVERVTAASADLRGNLDGKTVRAVMGVYLFDARYLCECVSTDAADPHSSHDFAADLLPNAATRGRVLAYDFRDRSGAAPAYWRDLCTLDGYWQAHMDLLDDPPKFDLFDPSWPIATYAATAAPARIVGSVRISAALLGRGSVIAGEVCRSVIGAGCTIGERARITGSVLLPGVRIGPGCVLDRVVIERGCEVSHDSSVGRTTAVETSYALSPRGVVLISGPHGGHRARRARAKVA
jgi:glucose-1-phosphate adenylyltransferase